MHIETSDKKNAPILVLTCKTLTSLSHGYDLRVLHLCKSLAVDTPLYMLNIILPDQKVDEGTLPFDNFFEKVELIQKSKNAVFSPKRHFRLNEADYWKLSSFSFFNKVSNRINTIVDEENIKKILVFGDNISCFAKECRGKFILVDVCDSHVLTILRENSHSEGRSFFEKIIKSITLFRVKRGEGSLSEWCSSVTTVNDADTKVVIGLSATNQDRIVTIPNGTHQSLLDQGGFNQEASRSVVFWGNLEFKPNDTAMRYFIEQVFIPLLLDRNIKLMIVGNNPQPWLVEAAKQCNQIILPGFVEDLHAVVSEHAIFVNSMQMGSGMKNKVLEALAWGIPIVSTALGIESISGAVDGEHYIESDSPSSFATSIIDLFNDDEKRKELSINGQRLVAERYTWERVGEQWRALVFRGHI